LAPALMAPSPGSIFWNLSDRDVFDKIFRKKKLKKTVAAVLPFLQVHYVGCKHGEPQSQYSYSIASQSLVSAPARTLHRLHKLTAASIRSFERGFTASDACSFLVATIERYSFSDTCCWSVDG
jgi:hypothetical protein